MLNAPGQDTANASSDTPLRVALMSCAHTHASSYAALLEARAALETQDVPIGAVVIGPDGRIFTIAGRGNRSGPNGDGAAYDAQAEKLKGMFRENFKRFEAGVDPKVTESMPNPDA